VNPHGDLAIGGDQAKFSKCDDTAVGVTAGGGAGDGGDAGEVLSFQRSSDLGDFLFDM